MTTNLLQLPEMEYLLPGNRACAGCSIGIAFRHVTKALDGKAVLVVPASCFTVLCGMYPTSSVTLPVVNCTFPSTAAVASGISASLKKQGRHDIATVAIAGDGGTADIGIQALSGAAERNTDLLFICYDNEAYMNTGTQRSSMTPLGARTTTTPNYGKQQYSKDVPAIMEAHNIPYIATASPGYPGDLYDKVYKARFMTGCRYMHLSAPCPAGWHFPAADTVTVARNAVESGAFVLYEIENGHFRLTGKSLRLAEKDKRISVGEYLSGQGRFAKTDDDTIALLQEQVDARWTEITARHFQENPGS
ncbi:MAG: pyruvate synthase subunit beta [Candidatus Hydrogenedentes bacterium]|jgi:pyruvate ferredoxin oxidoreductase beta subunit|nr:pyruvate synthase subunit beta [Candidatus Hydrogenedentota bacterium]